MLTPIEKILFALLLLVSLATSAQGFLQIYRAIRRGRPEARGSLAERLGQAIWLVITQRTVFRKRPWVSLLHAFVFYGFVYYLLVNVVDLLEGYFPFDPRGGLWNAFNLIADLLSGLILVGIVGLMIRRYLWPRNLEWPSRVTLHEKARAGIARDSAIVGAFIFVHVGSRILSQASLLALSQPDPFQPLASFLARGFQGLSPSSLEIVYHLFWWLALGSILLFLPYFPRSKHIHLFLAPLNLAWKKERPGALEPLDFERAEEGLGAARLEDFPWPRLLDAYSCIMCNRCQDACPAFATGKALSPAALLISERYELNAIRPRFAKGEASPRPLMEFAISPEALWACTTCNACVEVCPVGNEPMLHIVDIRRERVMMQGEFPSQLNSAFRGMERNGNPWGLSPAKRLDWAEGLNVPTLEERPEAEVLYWVGCAPSYDPRAQRVARALVELLNRSGVSWAVLGQKERCTGDAARRAGNEYLFAQLAEENVQNLNTWASAHPEGRILTTCPHCYHVLANEYPAFGGHYHVEHHSEFLARLLPELSIQGQEELTYHDPCYLGRHNGIYDAPREVLQQLGTLREAPRHRENSFCCGAGGAQFWKEEEPGNERIASQRLRELKVTGAQTIAVACPFCLQMLSQEEGPEILDLAELVVRNLPPAAEA